MKKVLILSLLVFLSCDLFNPPDHRLRIKNNAYYELEDFNFGKYSFNAAPNSYSEYQDVEEGKYEVYRYGPGAMVRETYKI